jgi:hypothetical protein
MSSENENPLLSAPVGRDTPLKTLVVDYVGNKVNPESGQVTVEMIVEVLAEEFPEFVLALAEENWIRGYRQALDDVERTVAEQESQSEASSTDSSEGA